MNYGLRRLIVVVVVFLLIVIGFILFWRLINRPSQPSQPVHRTELTDYASTDTVVKMVGGGKIVGDNEHNEVYITIGRTNRTIQIIQGYEGTVVKTETFANNESAYHTFLAALHNSGFTRSTRASELIMPEGACPMGRRFWYQIISSGSEFEQSLWNTNCGSIRGTFGGNSNTVQWLFKNQIPDYTDLTRGYNL